MVSVILVFVGVLDAFNDLPGEVKTHLCAAIFGLRISEKPFSSRYLVYSDLSLSVVLYVLDAPFALINFPCLRNDPPLLAILSTIFFMILNLSVSDDDVE